MLRTFYSSARNKILSIMIILMMAMLSGCVGHTRSPYCPISLAVQTASDTTGQSHNRFILRTPTFVVLKPSLALAPIYPLTDYWEYRQWVVAAHCHPGSYQPYCSGGHADVVFY